ncbi:hypothetical protein PFISCL1PPCAC_6676, partial [Pristionchus fissidentatus]
RFGMSKRRATSGQQVKQEMITLSDSDKLEESKKEIERLNKLLKDACEKALNAELRAEAAERLLDSKRDVYHACHVRI